jgi:aerobic-type carbon monoxide dehydrogenase small subunit (CoxS/CutS family)
MLSLTTIDGLVHEARAGERLIDLLNRSEIKIPQVCYHPQLGPIQTCDTCMVEVDGALVRACATTVSAGMSIKTNSAAANDAQREAMDRILSNHLLYCTVCDNSNGDCTVHNTTKFLAIEHQEIPFRTKPYHVDNTNPFYRYDGWRPEGWTPTHAEVSQRAGRDYTLVEALKTWQWYALWLLLFLNTFAGISIISQEAAIFRNLWASVQWWRRVWSESPASVMQSDVCFGRGFPI